MTLMTAPREKTFLLARPETRVLEWIARRLPRWVMPDHLTALGVLAAVGIAVAYVLSNRDPAWLWAASGLLVVHWLGDSLAGLWRGCAGPSGRATATTSTTSSTRSPRR
jgi:hypothetical protein